MMAPLRKSMRILFVCLGNTCRSPMAEAWVNHIADERNYELECESAGTIGYDGGAQTEALNVIRNTTGKDLLKDHRCRSMAEVDASQFDLILTMEDRLKGSIPGDNVFNLMEYGGGSGDVNDPYGGSFAEYQGSFTQIREGVARMLRRLEREKKI